MTSGRFLIWIMAWTTLSLGNCRCTASNRLNSELMSTACPFELVLDLSEGTELRADLINRSGSPQWVLHDQWIQPSELILRTRFGRHVSATDRRSVMKYDNTVRRESYRKLAPTESMMLFSATAERLDDGTFSLKWGPYEYDGIEPGRYRATVRWTSRERTWIDESSGESGHLDHVWLGTCTSEPVDIRLE